MNKNAKMISWGTKLDRTLRILNILCVIILMRFNFSFRKLKEKNVADLVNGMHINFSLFFVAMKVAKDKKPISVGHNATANSASSMNNQSTESVMQTEINK